jgi:hypothetical protein
MPGRQKHSMFMRVFAVLAFALVQAGAHGKTCSPKDAEAADAAVDHLDSWKKVDWAFRHYGHCDDGSIAEGNSEAIARLSVDRWDTLPELAKLIQHDLAMKQFVLRHFDTTLDTDDLEKIKELSSSKCSKGTALLCAELQTATARLTK